VVGLILFLLRAEGRSVLYVIDRLRGVLTLGRVVLTRSVMGWHALWWLLLMWLLMVLLILVVGGILRLGWVCDDGVWGVIED